MIDFKVLKPMHILWLPSWFPTSAHPLNGIFFKEQLKALSNHGLKIRMIYPDLRRLREFNGFNLIENHFQKSFCREDSLEMVFFHGWNLYPKQIKKQKEAFIKASFSLFQSYIKKFGKPDLIHAQSAFWGAFAAKSLSDAYSIPFIITEHLGEFLKGIALSPIDTCWTTPILKEVFEKSSKILSVSNAISAVLKKHYLPNQDHKFDIMPNCVDTDFFKQRKEKPKDNFHWISVSHLTQDKNLSFLLKSFSQVVKISPKTCLSIYGEGPLRKQLQSEIQSLNLTGHVRLCGQATREGVREALTKSHAFVLPSLAESFGVAYIEALATGLPIVATLKGGPKDFVTKANGYLVNPEKEEELIHAMIDCQKNIDFFDQEAIEQEAKQRFGVQTFVNRHLHLYENLLTKSPS